MDILIAAASEPVSVGRGSAVLGFVILVAVLMLFIPTRKK